MDGDDWFSLAELTTRLGALVWVEEQLAQVLTQWGAIEDHAPSAVVFATTARHHAWHAEIIRGCLPTSPQLLEDEVVCTPTAGWQTAVVSLRALTDPGDTAVRLKALVKIVGPWLDREIGALLELGRPVSDAAMSRWLQFVSIDHQHDGEAVAALLTSQSSNAVRFGDHRVIAELDLS